MKLEKKIDLILNLLGIWDPESQVENSSVLTDIYNKLIQLKKISEFNSIVIHEMIKSDLIPPVILKKAQLLTETIELKNNLEKLSHRFELLKKIKAPEKQLDETAKEMYNTQEKIEDKEKELKELQ